MSVSADAKNVLKERANKSVKTGQGKKQGKSYDMLDWKIKDHSSG